MIEKKINDINEFSFSKPAVYKIKVLGDLADIWSDRMGGMQITVERKTDQKPVSTLIGRISDQTALTGVLNSLYDLQMSVISVRMLLDIDEE